MDGDYGGYNAKIFVSNPPAEYDCSVCLQILKNPMSCKNGHCSCFTCISSALNVNKACPVCKVGLTSETLTKSLIVQQLIEKLPSFCVTCKRDDAQVITDCRWIGPLHARDDHYKNDCDFYPVKCKNIGCEIVSFRKDISQHKLQCLFSRSVCAYCHHTNPQEYLRGELEQHILVCEYRPVACPNNCDEMIPLNELKSHIDRHCPKTEVKCPLVNHSHYGYDCPGRAERKDMLNHLMGDCTVYETIVALTDMLNSSILEVKTLKNTMTTKDEQIAAMRVSIQEQDAELHRVNESSRLLEDKVYDLELQAALARGYEDDSSEDDEDESTEIDKIIATATISPTLPSDTDNLQPTNSSIQSESVVSVGSNESKNNDIAKIASLEISDNMSDNANCDQLLPQSLPDTSTNINQVPQKQSKNSKKNAKKAAKRKNPTAPVVYHIKSYGLNSVIQPHLQQESYVAATHYASDISLFEYYRSFLFSEILGQFERKWDNDSIADAQDVADFFTFSADYFAQFTTENLAELLSEMLINSKISYYDEISRLKSKKYAMSRLNKLNRMIIEGFIDNYRAKFLHFFLGEVTNSNTCFPYLRLFNTTIDNFHRGFQVNNQEFETLRNTVIIVSGSTVAEVNGRYTYFPYIANAGGFKNGDFAKNLQCDCSLVTSVIGEQLQAIIVMSCRCSVHQVTAPRAIS